MRPPQALYVLGKLFEWSLFNICSWPPVSHVCGYPGALRRTVSCLCLGSENDGTARKTARTVSKWARNLFVVFVTR